MKIQPFKSIEHLRTDDPRTEQSTFFFFNFCMLKRIIVYKIQNRGTVTLGGTLSSYYELGRKLINLFILPRFDFRFSHKKILPEAGPRI